MCVFFDSKNYYMNIDLFLPSNLFTCAGSFIKNKSENKKKINNQNTIIRQNFVYSRSNRSRNIGSQQGNTVFFVFFIFCSI